MRQESVHSEADAKLQFGKFLDVLLIEHQLKQAEIYSRLGWSADKFSLLVRGQRPLLFEDLSALVYALVEAKVTFSLQRLQQLVTLAYQRSRLQKTYKDRHSEDEWEHRFRHLAGELGLLSSSAMRSLRPSSAHLLEVTHLVKRDAWREDFLAVLEERRRKKVIVLRGAHGIGKSSELSWLAMHLSRQTLPTTHVVLYDCRSLDATAGPKAALRLLLGTLLTELGCILPAESRLSLDQQADLLTHAVEQHPHRLVLLVDHAECMLEEQGHLVMCWERFFSRWVRGSHRGTLLLATQQWPGWYSGEDQFVKELVLPPLSTEEAVTLLQLRGLQSVAEPLLSRVAQRMDGIPQALEWFVALTRQPLAADEWQELFTPEAGLARCGEQELLTQVVEDLLAEPYPFASSRADDIAPLLQRIIHTQRLSQEARVLLEVLSLAAVPLAQPALMVVCPTGIRPVKELRRASLLTTYEQRLHTNVVVASAVIRLLAPEVRHEREALLIETYTTWLSSGHCEEREAGTLVADLATLLLRHQRLLPAAEHLISYGWISFNQGHGPRLASFAEQAMKHCDWQSTLETECAGLLLQQVLFMFLGENVDATWQEHYQCFHDAFLAGEMNLPSACEQHLIHLLVMYTMNELRFEDAQVLLDAYRSRLEARQVPPLEQDTPLLNEYAVLYSTWSDYAEEQGDMQKTRALREQAIALYKQHIALLSKRKIQFPLNNSLLQRALAHCYNNLSYELSKNRQHEEALQFVECGIDLKEQGYACFGVLAASYGEKSEILVELGQFHEALRFDKKALAEIQRCADAGDALSRDEVWVYKVNRGRLYLRLGRVGEAEQLLQEALPYIRPERRMYQMFAKKALEEIEQWRRQAASPQHQLDWRWVGQYRELTSYDGHGWLAHAGPFTEEEQQQWNSLFPSRAQEAVKVQLGTLITQSRERELAAAIAEQREPRLQYPAIEIEEVRRRVAELLQLDIEISQHEPNAIVRRLYHDAIEEEVSFLRLIEATYEGDTEKYWACNLRLDLKPSPEEVDYALLHIKRAILQGLKCPEAAEVSQRLREFLQMHLHLSLDLAPGCEESEEIQQEASSSSAQSQPTVSAQAAKRFFEAVLHESGYDDWRVVIDTSATNPRVESGLRVFFLSNRRFYLEEVRYWFAHELVGHIVRAVAGERSPLGLLAFGTRNYLPTEEGFVYYHERQMAALHGQTLKEDGIWFGTLTTGLACGVVTPAQTFLSLYSFLELYTLLRQLLQHPDVNVQEMQQRTQKHALHLCLRTYRGVPNLERTGVCYLKDSVYLRGVRMVERAVAEDKTVLDRLAVGRVALEYLPDMQELDIVSVPQPLLKLAYDPELDTHILSFEAQSEESSCQQA